MIGTTALVAFCFASTAALACSPAPSCWMKEGPAYLRSVCKSSQSQAVAEIRKYADEPELVPTFVNACKKMGITLK
jgi:hypothetical protein